MTAPMKLYMSKTSPYARLARIVVIEKGLTDQVEEIEARTRTTDSPYYAINPSGRIPYLVLADGTAFEDSVVICDYLDSLDGAPRFTRPGGAAHWTAARREAEARSLLDGLSVWIRELKRPEDERSPTVIAHEAARAQRLADQWEALADDPVLTGPFNTVQMVLVTALEMEHRLPDCDWRTGRPGLGAWHGRIAGRPSLVATHPAAS